MMKFRVLQIVWVLLLVAVVFIPVLMSIKVKHDIIVDCLVVVLATAITGIVIGVLTGISVIVCQIISYIKDGSFMYNEDYFNKLLDYTVKLPITIGNWYVMRNIPTN